MIPRMDCPCAFSPCTRNAQRLARFYAAMFPERSVILDLGFGQGHFLEAARARGMSSLGIDRDASLVSSAVKRGFDARQGDVRELDALVPTKVDGAIAAHLIEHLHPYEVGDLLAAVARRVKRGGSFVVATPNFSDWRVASEWFWYDPTHVRPYAAQTVEQLADAREWCLDAEGTEPMGLSKETPKILFQRLRFGSHYGRPGRWFRLVRV